MGDDTVLEQESLRYAENQGATGRHWYVLIQ